jgi:hypothetical protein
MDDNKQTPAVQSPIGFAAIVCCIFLIVVYWTTRRVVDLLEVDWAKFLAYVIIPISATFIILYRSNWHPEMVGVKRTGSMLLLSCSVMGGVLIAIGLMLGIFLFLVNAISGGNH